MRHVFAVGAVALFMASGAQAVVNHEARVFCGQFLPLGGNVDYTFELNPGEITAFMTAPSSALPINFSTPDTILQLFGPGDTFIHGNDDAGSNSDAVGGSAVTPTRGSAMRHFSTAAGAYTYRVSGFEGGESGTFTGSFFRFVPGGTRDFDDTEGNNSVATAQLLDISTGGARLGFGSLTNNDLDFFAINVAAGDIISAMTIPLDSLTANNFSAVDTRLDIRDANGNIITSNDDGGGDAFGFSDAGPTRGSVIRYHALTDGVIYLSVRGFQGTDVGNYALGVSVCAIPTPGAAALLLTALPMIARRRR